MWYEKGVSARVPSFLRIAAVISSVVLSETEFLKTIRAPQLGSRTGNSFRCDRAEVQGFFRTSDVGFIFGPWLAGVERLLILHRACFLHIGRKDSAHRYSLMSSSLTADGVNTPRSVNSRVMRDGEV